MMCKANQRGRQPALPGIERKTLVYGDRTLMTEFRMRKGSALPRHAHPQERNRMLLADAGVARRQAWRPFCGGFDSTKVCDRQ